MNSREKLLQLRHDFYIKKELNYDSILYFTAIEKDLEILEILKECPFVLEKMFACKELKNQKEYQKRYFWSTITDEKWLKVKEWLEND